MRRPLIAGNWKMNLTRDESVSLALALCQADSSKNVDILICPPYVYLDAVSQAVAESSISVGSQDVYFEASGAFTGEISVDMLKDVGVQFIILGHSERRHVIGESDLLINKKIRAVLSGGLTPVVCVGETLEERERGETLDVIKSQFEGSLDGLTADQMKNSVIAYEPVWAIGTGKTASPEEAQAVHADLRKLLAGRYNQGTSEHVRILYGGSVKPDNAANLMAQADIDGALVGGASLKSDSFIEIINATGVSAG